MGEGRGSCKPNADFVVAIRELRSLMIFLGIWQQSDLPRWYRLIWYIHSFGMMFAVFGPVAGLIVNRYDAAKIIDHLGMTISAGAAFLQWLMFGAHSETIGKLSEFMEKDWINLEKSDSASASVPGSKQIMTRYYKSARNVFFLFVIFMGLGGASSVEEALASLAVRKNSTDYDPNAFPIPYSWYPVDLEEGYAYPIVFALQAVIATIIASTKPAICNFFYTVTSNLCGQFETLRHFTESITYDSSRPGHCEAQVRLMIRRHQELFEATKGLQKAFSTMIAGEYTSVTLTICFYGYAIIAELEGRESSLSDILCIAFFCGAFLLLIFSSCFIGDRLTNQSIAVAKAVYNSEWYNCPRSVCLSLLISIARAQRPVIISEAGLIPMSLKNFMTIIKASASYLSVLRRAVGVTDGCGEQ